MLRAILAMSLLVAGVLSGCTEPEAPPVVEAPPPAPVPFDEPMDWTGLIGAGLCAQTSGTVSISMCGLYLPSLGSPGSRSDWEPAWAYDPDDGLDLAGGRLQLSWDPESIGTEGLRVRAWLLEDCPDECTANRTFLSTAGPGPIDIPLDAADLREDMLLVVAVAPADLTKGLAASTGQEIHLTGTVSFVEDVDGDPEGDDEDEEEDDD